jgi:CRP/FNR family transcriptional regulator, anaerobic regulatory protein
MDNQLLQPLIKSYPIFAELPDPLMQSLLHQAMLIKVSQGTSLFSEHQVCELFPLVIKGTIKVEKLGENGRRLKLYEVGPGEGCVLTGSCLLSNVSYTARGEAVSDLEIVGIPRALFMTLIDEFEPFRRQVFQLVAERMAELMALVEEVAFHRLDQRLAARLLGHGAKLKVTHQELADELGSVREIVSRVLGQFADDGLIRSARQEIEVLDAVRLRARVSS